MGKPEEYPDIVYKYRNWTEEYHKAVLKENQLFLTSPKYFNDPFDCRIPENLFLLNTPEKIKSYVDSLTIRHFEWLNKEGRDIEYEIKQVEDRLTNDLEKEQKENEQFTFERQDKSYGVLSLSTMWNSILMWSHYADHHKGYCVGFWEEKLRNSGYFGKGGPVFYDPNNNFPQIDPLDDNLKEKSFIETHSKANDWKYEEEYRLTKLFYPDEPTDADRTVTIPDDFFAEIIIALKTPENDKGEIIDLAKQKSIKVFQAYKKPFKFQIDRDNIHT